MTPFHHSNILSFNLLLLEGMAGATAEHSEPCYPVGHVVSLITPNFYG